MGQHEELGPRGRAFVPARVASMRRALTSKLGKLAQDFNDVQVMCECEREIAQARSSAASGAFGTMGTLLKKALQFAGPSFVDAMVGEGAQVSSPASQRPDKKSMLGKHPVGPPDEYSIESTGSLMPDDSAILGSGMKGTMGELEMSDLECTRVADINLGDEITPDSDDATSVNQASASGPSSSTSSHASSISDEV